MLTTWLWPICSHVAQFWTLVDTTVAAATLSSEQRPLALCERIPFWPELRKILGNSISPATIVQQHAVTAILKLSVVSTCVLPSRRLAATLSVDPEGY
jgi:hypothetical protein